MYDSKQNPDPQLIRGQPLQIVVEKSKRKLRVVSNGRNIVEFRVGLGSNPTGTKLREGDGATPEGSYRVCRKNPKSNYTLSLGINYPNDADAQRGLSQGLLSQEEYDAILEANAQGATPPQKTAIGGDIFIHGKGSKTDWTLGCIGLEDDDVRYLYEAIPIGTPVIILP